MKIIIGKVIDVMAVRAHKKNIELVYYINPDVPIELLGDPLRLRQVLTNLIGNAIKFTKKGEIILTVKTNPDNKNLGALLFSISDTGIGIANDKIDKIFDSFTQSDFINNP